MLVVVFGFACLALISCQSARCFEAVHVHAPSAELDRARSLQRVHPKTQIRLLSVDGHLHLPSGPLNGNRCIVHRNGHSIRSVNAV